MDPNTAVPNCTDVTFGLKNGTFWNNCSSVLPKCNSNGEKTPGFNFTALWSLTQDYAEQCPNGTWLFREPGITGPVNTKSIAFTNEVCEIIAGSDWTQYPGSDIWTRLTTWKFPLFQLVANSPRPPLGFGIEAFSVAHFLGDPVGTLRDLLRKIDECQSRAVFWQDRLHNELRPLYDERTPEERRRLWKALAIIVVSFDEFGTNVGNRAQAYLLAELTRFSAPNADLAIRQRYLHVCLQTADALSADRSTKFLPVIIAQSFFIGSVIIAMIRTGLASKALLPNTYINIEMYSIAFTAQYFWVIFAVFWASIIGTSQTEAAIPRILNRFRRDLESQFSAHGMAINLPTNMLDDEQRMYRGSVYSWQPQPSHIRRSSLFGNSALEHRLYRDKTFRPSKLQRVVLATVLHAWPFILYLLPLLVVTAAAATGQVMSAVVPPEGWSCRSVGMMWMYISWIASYVVSLIPVGNRLRFLYWATLVKDLLVVGVTLGIIIVTQFGIYNRCDCYTKNGLTGLKLPFMPDVKDVLESRLGDVYPAIVTLGLATQLVLFPALLIWRYHAAVQVFLQRDDGASNIDWWYMFRRWSRGENYVAVDQAGLDGRPQRQGDDRDEEQVDLQQVRRLQRAGDDR